ncbi:MAG: VWA domain-containing protein [Oscillospiraceae bacterium]|nr:VWA domain-containing protein [Oscillospiraceae bacterium]
MKKRNGSWKKYIALMLALIMALGGLSGVTVPVGARTAVFGGLGIKDTDPPTVNEWKNVIVDLDTSYAGGVWTDKSVFESAEAYFEATDEEENFTMELQNPRDFLISLSAIASTKTIVGYSTLPTDTMFILDVSGSMDSGNRDVRMVQAANKAIGDLLALNNYNRVGVVLYSSNATLMMPLDRYTTTSTTTVDNVTIPSYIYLNNNDEVVVSAGVRDSNNSRPNGKREVVGATYIQKGIEVAMGQLTAADLQTTITEGFQAGTTRTPIMVLMSDGAPTYATNSYTNIGNYNMGNGQSSSTTGDMAFVTQLTASWAKEKVARKYGDEVEPLFYTLGLGVGSDANALSVMDPNNAGASTTANSNWSRFERLNEGSSMSLNDHNDRRVTKLNDGVNDRNDTMPLSKNYVDRYFAAGTSNELSTAFQSIVDTIILQTMYYPTLVEGGDVHHSGHLEFRDYIGPNMEVKQVEGIQLGSTLYTGERFAKLVATGMGTPENPTEEGTELVHSLITRLDLGESSDPAAVQTAQQLIAKAWQYGQLAYNTDYDGNVTWSNWIGWYADENDKYLGFWDGDGIDAEMVGKAAYAIKSYLVMGGVGEDKRETDMFYASIQIRSALDADGNVTEDIVYGRLPASLIPMVEYHVSLDSNDPMTAKKITLSQSGATAPSRLIYEVGLRSDIDILDLEGTAAEGLKTDENGNFVFYTDQWDTTGLSEGVAPNKLHNAYVNFFPSEENERYYYHEDTPIYVRGDNGFVKYYGREPVAGDGNSYYHAHVIYRAASNGGTASVEVEYAQIPASALTADTVKQVEGTNNWMIKKGTLHLFEARTAANKTENTTATLPYSEYPIVHDDADMGYHLDGILGNNGILTIDAPEGIKLTKRIDDTLVDDGTTYTFRVDLTSGSHADATVYLITETDGVRSAWQEIDFADTYTVELAPGDVAWLAGLPEGNTYTVTEEVDGEYEVSAITVDGDDMEEAVITVEDDHIADVVFTNSAVFTGDVEIGKTVISDFAPHMTSQYAFRFDFAVTVTDADPDAEYAVDLVQADGTVVNWESFCADEEGKIEFELELSHGESVLIRDLPEGAQVYAAETMLPGFTGDRTDDEETVSVIAGETARVTFTNTYEAEPVSPTAVDVFAKKILQGRDWAEGDSFTFSVEKHVSSEEHTVIEEVEVDYSDDDKIADFQSNAGERYTEPGTYSYRVVEKPGDLAGVAYDSAICYFDIVVKDDGEGHLYIADVIGRRDVEIVYDDATETWDVIAEFTNVYNSEGSVQASLGVVKDVEDDAETGIDKAGFEFELYEADEDFDIDDAPRATVTTNAEGVAAFPDTVFTEEGTYYFVLKEVEGDDPRMEYDPAEYRFTVEITSDPETSGLVAAGTVTDADGKVLYEEEVAYDPETQIVPVLSYAAEFTNVYEPLSTETAIAGVKELIGRDINDGEFTFELYEAELTDDGFVTGNYITETTNTDDAFRFEDLDALTYSKTGLYYYAVKEEKGELGGVTYDEDTVYVTVQVTADLANGALTVNSVNTTDAQGNSAMLKFTNTYRAEGTSGTIEADKTMTGRTLAADMFRFQLKDAASSEVLQTVTNDAQGKISFTVDYTAPGEFDYIISEQIPTGVDANGRLNGVLYDTVQWPVHVVVRDDLAGQLVTEVSYPEGAPAFANDYTPAATTATIRGQKVLEGRAQTAGEFTFELYETDAAFVPLDGVADGTAATYDMGGSFGFSFGERTYSKAGGYRYIVVEKNTGDDQIDYDLTVYYVLVAVTDDGEGRLESKVTVGNAIENGLITAPVNAVEFYNVFNHEATKLQIGGSKKLEGHGWSHDGTAHQFTFELYEANEEFAVVEGTAPLTAANDPTAAGKEGAFLFPELTFDQEGTYYYVVRERFPAGVTAEDPRDDVTGIVYDTRELHVTVTVAEDPADPLALKATYTVNGAESIEFVNRYTTEGSVLATISGKKVMEGRALHADGFTFILKDSSGKEVERVINNGDGTSNEGTFSFHALTFDKADTYTYTVEEEKGSVAGVTYSEEVYTVTIKVGHKDGKLLEPEITYQNGDKAADAMVFTNVYKAAESDKLVISGTKTLLGGILKDKQFTFELYAAAVDADGVFVQGDKLAEATNIGTVFTFGGLSYQTVGEYHYIIKEQAGHETGVTYDDNVFYVTVLAEDPGTGKLTAEVSQIASEKTVSGAGVEFSNIFTPAPITVSFSGKKSLSGRDMVDGEFTFELFETGADHLVAEGAQPVDTASNQNRSFTFDEVELSVAGAYYFVVREVKGSAANVTYDSTVYNITVLVSNNNGVLEKTVTYRVGTEEKAEMEFRNTYKKLDPQPKALEIELQIEKVMRGDFGLDGFEFELLDRDGDVIDTARSDRRGEATLEVGPFRKADAGKTYTYYIREVDTDIPGISYSTREYEVQIAIYYDSARNVLSYELVKDGEVVDEDEAFVFTNIYHSGGSDGPVDPYEPPYTPTSPKTGDEGTGLWTAMLIVGILGFAVTAIALFRRRRA